MEEFNHHRVEYKKIFYQLRKHFKNCNQILKSLINIYESEIERPIGEWQFSSFLFNDGEYYGFYKWFTDLDDHIMKSIIILSGLEK